MTKSKKKEDKKSSSKKSKSPQVKKIWDGERFQTIKI